MSRTTYGPVPTGNDGVLSCMVQIPADNATGSGQNRFTFTEKFKGPWTMIQELPFKRISGVGPFQFGVKRSSVMPAKSSNAIIERFDPPAPPYGKAWVLQGCSTTELEAGDHAELTLDWMAQDPDWKPDDGSMSTDDLEKHSINWECNWIAYSENVLAYCEEGGVKKHIESQDLKAYAGNVRCWAQANADDLQHWRFREGGESFFLNYKEQEIAKFYASNRNPTFHAPVITMTDTWKTMTLDNQIEVGDNIDHIQLLSSLSCAFRFPDEWEFLKVGDTVTYSYAPSYITDLSATHTIFNITKRTQWQGALKFEPHFYGEGATRWKIGGNDVSAN